MVAIGEKLDSFSQITSLTTNSMVINKNVTGTGSTDVYIYQSRGLKDNSIQNFCDRFRTAGNGQRIKCLVSNVSSIVGSIGGENGFVGLIALLLIVGLLRK